VSVGVRADLFALIALQLIYVKERKVGSQVIYLVYNKEFFGQVHEYLSFIFTTVRRKDKIMKSMLLVPTIWKCFVC
jgi:hypothetical protein